MPRFHAILIDSARFDEPEMSGESLHEVKSWGRRILTGASEEATVKIYEWKEVLIDTLRKEKPAA